MIFIFCNGFEKDKALQSKTIRKSVDPINHSSNFQGMLSPDKNLNLNQSNQKTLR